MHPIACALELQCGALLTHPGAERAARTMTMGVAGEANRAVDRRRGRGLVVASYFDLLAAELRGERPSDRRSRVRELHSG